MVSPAAGSLDDAGWRHAVREPGAWVWLAGHARAQSSGATSVQTPRFRDAPIGKRASTEGANACCWGTTRARRSTRTCSARHVRQRVAEDDDGGTQKCVQPRSAQLRFTAPAPGFYTVRATSYEIAANNDTIDPTPTATTRSRSWAGPLASPRDPRTTKAPTCRAFARCAEEDSNLHPVIPDQALNLVTQSGDPSKSCSSVQIVWSRGRSGRIGRSGCCHGCCHGSRHRD
jgi:hypothetical protein